jgi:hypothetical protein
MSLADIVDTYSEQPNLLDKIEKWRVHRAELAVAGTGPIRLAGETTMLFHLIPASSLTRRTLQETWRIADDEKHQVYVPHGATNLTYNADGFLCLSQMGNQSGAYGYTQLFRSGIVEYADCNCSGPAGPSESMILGQAIEGEIVRCYQDAVRRLRKEGKNEPVYAGLSLVGLANKEFFSTYRNRAFGTSAKVIDNIYISPEILVDINAPEESPYGRTLLPLVDTMWQVAGRPRTPFMSNGEWNPFTNYN